MEPYGHCFGSRQWKTDTGKASLSEDVHVSAIRLWPEVELPAGNTKYTERRRLVWPVLNDVGSSNIIGGVRASVFRLKTCLIVLCELLSNRYNSVCGA